MKILITGANGMLAQDVIQEFTTNHPEDQNELLLTDAKQLDITDAAAVQQYIEQHQPDFIINCAAYTAVDKAENQPELAMKINADGPANLAKAAAQASAHPIPLIHISTDYVFGGDKPIAETYQEDDPKHPQSVYGKTKLAGEEAITTNTDHYYIFRTAWLYGKGHNFVQTMLDLAQDHSEVKVVDDQYGSPTATKDLASIIYQAVTKQIPYGIYHATNQGFTNWYEFTNLIYELKGIATKVIPVSSSEFAAKAPRPHNSQLDKSKLLAAGVTIPDYQDSLKLYLGVN